MINKNNEFGILCGEMAASIARYVSKITINGTPAKKGVVFHHMFQTDFSESALALHAFGVAEPVHIDGVAEKDLYYNHTLLLDADDIPKFLAQRVQENDSRFPQLLEAFIRIAANYENLPTTRNLFSCPERLIEVMNRLVEGKFAEKVGDQFRWTEKISPAMRAAYLWDEHDNSYSDSEEHRLETESDNAVRTMPTDIRKAFEDNPENLIGWTAVLSTRWKDGAWHDAPDDARITLSGGLGLARRVMAKFKAGLTKIH